MKKDSQTSWCWNYFEKVEGGGKCLKCKKVIASFGNTSNFVKHLRRLHKSTYDSAETLQRKRNDSSDYEEIEGEGVSPSEEDNSEAIAEANSAVHTIQAYRDVNGTTYLYLHPTEGETGIQIQQNPLQPVVASTESLGANGEIVTVAVQKDAPASGGQVIDGEAKSQEDPSPRKLVHAPVKNYQGSSVAARTLLRQVSRPSPLKTASPANSSQNSNKEDTFDNFGKYIASMLRNLPSKTACKLQGEIVNWILKEQMKS